MCYYVYKVSKNKWNAKWQGEKKIKFPLFLALSKEI